MHILRCATPALLLGIVLSAQRADAGQFEHCEAIETRYEIIMLGNLGAPGGGASDVNELGQVTGASSRSDQVGRAFVWDCFHGMRNIGALAEDQFSSVGLYINNKGEIVGQSFSEDQSHTFIWDRRNSMRAVGDGYPLSFSNRSDATLSRSDGVVLWNEASGAVSLLSLTGITFRDAYVNDRREVGGFGFHPDTPDQFFVWSARYGIDPRGPEPPGTFMNVLRGFNNRSELLGITFHFDAAVPFIVRRNGEYEALFDPIANQYYEATAFNGRGQVVGFNFTAGSSEQQQPFLWDPENGVRNLNVLVYGRIPGTDEARIVRAEGINEWGWIAAGAVPENGTFSEPALLVPVPANERRFRGLGQLRGVALCRTLVAASLQTTASSLKCRR
jgi:hypothetical protein